MAQECLFCMIASRDIPSEVVFENEWVLAFRDITPKAPSHVLIIPKEHIARLSDITPSNSSVVARVYEAVAEIAHAEGLCDSGYRVVANCNSDAGQTVFHIHFHLLGGRQMGWPPG